MTRRRFIGVLGSLVGLAITAPFLPLLPNESRLDMIKRLMKNAINAHDDKIERAIFLQDTYKTSHWKQLR